MSNEDIKDLLERKCKEAQDRHYAVCLPGAEHYKSGFNAALELLLPCVEALEDIQSKRLTDIYIEDKLDGYGYAVKRSCDAIEDLCKKLEEDGDEDDYEARQLSRGGPSKVWSE